MLRKLFAIFKQKVFFLLYEHSLGNCGKNLKINNKCKFTKYTFIADNCNFNGMEIYGEGEVHIGNYFHSGKDCEMITSFHDYDNDDYIPYGFNNIKKNIYIGDFVWIGNRVTILGGVNIGEGALFKLVV